MGRRCDTFAWHIGFKFGMGVPLPDGAWGLTPTNRVLVASYGFTVLVTVTMRQFVRPEVVSGERRNKASGQRRWGMNDDTCKRFLVTLFAVLCGLGDVREPILANLFRGAPA
jgi:hypothetical protein